MFSSKYNRNQTTPASLGNILVLEIILGYYKFQHNGRLQRLQITLITSSRNHKYSIFALVCVYCVVVTKSNTLALFIDFNI